MFWDHGWPNSNGKAPPANCPANAALLPVHYPVNDVLLAGRDHVYNSQLAGH